MKRFAKVCLWTSLALGLLGLLLMSVSFAIGFRIRFWEPKTTPEQIETRNETVQGAIRNLSFEVEAGSLSVEEGDTFSVVGYSKGSRIDSHVEDGTWHITSGQEEEKGGSLVGGFYVDGQGIYLKKALGEVHVTIPRDAVFEQVEIRVKAGAFQSGTLACDELEAEVESGSATFELLDIGTKAKIHAATGAVDGTLAGSEEDYSVEMDCSLGSIFAGSSELGGIVLGEEHYDIGEKDLELSCDLGAITLSFEEEMR